ncbi:MAG: GMP synthase (glutamine-hydrolyzing), partial [Candidatus Aminicenantes bacterium]
MHKDWIAILDFGSQYTHLIARRVREYGVYSEIVTNDVSARALSVRVPKAIILSGGPASVVSGKSLICDKDIFNMGVPILGICYGAQLMVKMLGGRVVKAKAGEYGKAILKISIRDNLFNGLSKEETVWMSHGDKITALPQGFKIIGSTDNAEIAAMADMARSFYGMQFHPEVIHTPKGKRILRNFIFDISKCKNSWNMHSFAKNAIQILKNKIGNEKVLCALSGGVDSSVLITLLHKAINKNLIAVFIDNGLLRQDEAMIVKKRFGKYYNINLKVINAQNIFLNALNGVEDPEEKRKIIGRLFIEVFSKEARKLGEIKFLAQGTLYPDVIESKAPIGGTSTTIKSHHNVGGLPKNLGFRLIEPLRDLFKDEVRKLGKELGLPDEIIYRQPFPGPGLAVRIIGEVNKKRLNALRAADKILLDEIKAAGLYAKLWQSFCILLSLKSVGVMGDKRTYENAMAIRAVNSEDAMTAHWARIPYPLLEKISNRIINEVKGIN